MVSQKSIILTGPTATGKTTLALAAAAAHPQLELVNADSLLIFREMNIGTAKPTAQELTLVAHHLIDIRSPAETFTAGDFVREVEKVLIDIHSRGKRALLVGGSGFYLKALLYGLWDVPAANLIIRAELEKENNVTLFNRLALHDEQSALKISQNDRYRLIRALEIHQLTGKTPGDFKPPENPNPRFALWVIDRATDELHARIAKRTEQMLADGLIDEVKTVREKYPTSRALDAVGYRETIHFLNGTTPEGRKVRVGLPGLQDEIELGTRQLVKRQRTWFRGQKHREDFVLPQDESRLLENLVKFYET